MGGTAIEAVGLTKRYGDRTAIDSVTFSVPTGVIFGFLGPNGAGKTTTMRVLTTLTPPTDGDAWVAGRSITDRHAVTARIGYLPENPPVYDVLTGREQLRYAAGIRNLGGDIEDVIEEWLGRFDLAADADTRIAGYSRGMRQKIGIIQALLHEPSVLFLDEPMSGLDPRAARTLRETISAYVEDGGTVFLSTHVLGVLESLADRVGIIHDGQLLAAGEPAALTTGHESLESLFLALTDGEAHPLST